MPPRSDVLASAHDALRGIALPALAALAVAMGIGRFAFTPILPMMLADAAIGVPEGGVLASANYLGYLAGALTATRIAWPPRTGIRLGLILIAIATAGMALVDGMIAWAVLRAVAGVASAWVLVYVSAWALEQLQVANRGELGGVIYAGVGSGIVFAGLACLVLSRAGASAAAAWTLLGASAAVATLLVWPRVASGARGVAAPAASAHGGRTSGYWTSVVCYGLYGLGYIIPATFLPVMAKQAMGGSAGFEWVWPAFGAAAVASTVLAGRAAQRIGPRGVWIRCHVVLAFGVALPIVMPDALGLTISALCVGGTFTTITMAAMQDARRIAGPRARSLMAAMTAAFAAGQVVGPLLISALAHFTHGVSIALAIAAVPVLATAVVLHLDRGHDAAGA
jgi:predicted MFS family arabinose efflux permease